ncbi:MAG: hypothetical protein OEW22_08655 [Rubrivivax sp.]|nr:hypothetical protein [Rubrivivax sp.]
MSVRTIFARLRMLVALAATGFGLAACSTYDSYGYGPNVHGSVSMYGGYGYYRPWYHGGYYRPPSISPRPPMGRPMNPIERPARPMPMPMPSRMPMPRPAMPSRR